MFKYGLVLFVFLSLNSFAGKIEDAQLEAIMRKTDENMRDRLPLYQEAYQVLHRHRLLPWDHVSVWKGDRLPCGPVYEKNIFHFFWARSLINAEMLMNTAFIEFHLNYCCANRAHGVEMFTQPNPLSDYFREEMTKLWGVLGTVDQLFFKELPADKKTKIPDYIEVFFLDYLVAREGMLRYNCHNCKRGLRPVADVLAWSYMEPVTKRNIGKSLAYKLSSPETFTKFALVPLMKYLPLAAPGGDPYSLKFNHKAMEAIITEILLGFYLHHVDADLSILEDVNTQEALDDLVKQYDSFGVITKMKDLSIMITAFREFYVSLGAYPEIKANLDEVKKAVGF